MELNQFAAMVTARGCTEVNGSGQKRFVGTFAGHPFSTSFNRGSAGKTVFGLHFVPGRNFPAKQVLSQLKQTFNKQAAVKMIPLNQNQNGFGSVPRGAIALMFTFTAPEESVEMVFDTALQVITGVINATRAFVPDECPVCRLPGCDAFGLNGAFYRPVHAACIQQKSTETFGKVQQNEYTGSYALGAVGALLGAMVGALPTILLMVLSNTISLWLTMLIPLAAYFGYSKLRGKMTKLSALFVAIASVLVAPVMLYITYAVQVQKELHYFLSLNVFFQAIAEVPGVRGDLMQVLLFTGLGILVTLGITLRGNKQSWNDAAAELASLRPIHPGQPQPISPMPVLEAAEAPDITNG